MEVNWVDSATNIAHDPAVSHSVSETIDVEGQGGIIAWKLARLFVPCFPAGADPKNVWQIFVVGLGTRYSGGP